MARPIQLSIARSNGRDGRPIQRIGKGCIDLKRPTRFGEIARTVDGRDRRPARDRPTARLESNPELNPADPATDRSADLAIGTDPIGRAN